MRLTRESVSLTALVLGLGILLLLRAPPTPIMSPDSPLYLGWGPTVPLGYPAFVHVFSGWSLIAAQVGLYTAAVLTIAHVVRRLPGGWWVSVLLALALFANPQTDGLLWSTLSEGLFLPLNVLLIALLISFSDRGTTRTALAAALVAGLCAAVRPASLPLGLVAVLACLLRWEERTWRVRFMLALASLLIWGGVVGAERIGSRLVHGDAVTSLTGPHLFGKAALLDVPDPMKPATSPQARIVAETMENDFAPVRRLLNSQHGTVAYPPLLAFYEVCVQHPCSESMRAQLGLPFAQANRLIAHVALERIKQNPGGYLRQVWDEYRSLWVFGVRSHPVLGPAYDAQIARLRPMPFEGVVAPEMTMRSTPSRATLLIRPAFIAMGIAVALLCIGLSYACLVRREPSPLVLPSLLAALSTQAIMVFTAFVGIGDGRYTMGLWPDIASALVLSLIPLRYWISPYLSRGAHDRRRIQSA